MFLGRVGHFVVASSATTTGSSEGIRAGETAGRGRSARERRATSAFAEALDAQQRALGEPERDSRIARGRQPQATAPTDPDSAAAESAVSRRLADDRPVTGEEAAIQAAEVAQQPFDVATPVAAAASDVVADDTSTGDEAPSVDAASVAVPPPPVAPVEAVAPSTPASVAPVAADTAPVPATTASAAAAVAPVATPPVPTTPAAPSTPVVAVAGAVAPGADVAPLAPAAAQAGAVAAEVPAVVPEGPAAETVEVVATEAVVTGSAATQAAPVVPAAAAALVPASQTEAVADQTPGEPQAKADVAPATGPAGRQAATLEPAQAQPAKAASQPKAGDEAGPDTRREGKVEGARETRSDARAETRMEMRAEIRAEIRAEASTPSQPSTPASAAMDMSAQTAPAQSQVPQAPSAPAAGPLSFAHEVAQKVATQTQAAGSVVPVHALAVTIAARASTGSTRFDIKLDPPELGRIEVQMTLDREGRVKSRLVVEKQETLDLLQRDQRNLERALAQAGLDSREGSIEFSLKDQGAGSRQDQGERPQRQWPVTAEDPEAAQTVAVQAATYSRLAAARGGIDIRI